MSSKAEVKQFLEARGYRCFGTSPLKPHAILYQKRVDTETGKKFFEVWEWDLSSMCENARPGYEVEVCFGTDVDDAWFKGVFYGLNGSQLIEKLTVCEARLDQVFNVTGGKEK